MSLKSGIKSAVIISFMVILVFIGGCTKEKAEAIKVAAEQFLVTAITADNQIEYLLLQSVSMPFMNEKEKVDEIAEKLDAASGMITSDIINNLLTENRIGEDAIRIIKTKFGELKDKIRLFESMFHSLPAGSYFAKDAVKNAEKHAINVTLEFINFADFLYKMHVQYTARRILILEKIAKDKAIQEVNLRELNLKLSAQAIFELANDETNAKDEAILQCLKAAEAAKLVAELIRDYGKLSVGDILAMIKDNLGFANKISGGSLDSLMSDYKSVEKVITEDEYWSKVRNFKIN